MSLCSSPVKISSLRYATRCPKAFGEYKKRALDVLVKGDPSVNDRNLLRYKKVSEKLRELRQEDADPEWEDDEALDLRIRNLRNEEARLTRRLAKKYGNILSLFSGIRGFSGPTLLLWLAEIPELRGFKTFRDFKSYLGLCGDSGCSYNKKARNLLWLLSCQVRKYDPERRKSESVWQTCRRLAAEAWGRLRA